MSSHTISDLRRLLFDTIQGVRDGTMDVDKGKTISDLAKVVVDSAKVEVDFMKLRGSDQKGTGFIPEERQIGPTEPAAALPLKGNGKVQ